MNRTAIMAGAAFVAAAFGMPAPGPASGQEAGDRMRVTFGANWVVGDLIRMSPGEVELAVAGGGSRVFRADSLSQVERMVRKSQGKRGFVIGGATGWVLGGTVLSWAAEALEGDLTTFSDKVGYFALSAVVFGIPCGILGAIIGSGITRDRWETVPGWGTGGTTAGLMLELQPGPQGGTGLLVGGRIRF